MLSIDVNVELIGIVDNVITDDVKVHNLITDRGLQRMGNLLTTTDIINRIAFGSGANPANISDIALQTQIGIYNLIQNDVTGRTLTAITMVPLLDLVGQTIREVGLFDSGNNLIARAVLPAPINKTNQKAVQASWSIIFNRES